MRLVTHEQNMLWERIDKTMLLCHADRAPSIEEWKAYARDLLDGAGDGSLLSLLVFTDGAGPNAAQRKMIAGVPPSFRTAVVTRATIARGMVTAISWLGVNIRSFAPSDMRGAVAWLGVNPAKSEHVMRMIAASRLKLMGHKPPHNVSPQQVTQILESRFGDASTPRER